MYPSFEKLTKSEKKTLQILLDDFINEERREQFLFLFKEDAVPLEIYKFAEIAPSHGAGYYRLTQQGAIYAASVLSDYDKDKFFDRFNEVFSV